MQCYDVFPSFVFSFRVLGLVSLKTVNLEKPQLKTPFQNTINRGYNKMCTPNILISPPLPLLKSFHSKNFEDEFETLHYSRRKEKEACPFRYARSLHPGVRLVSSHVIRGNRIIGRSLPYGICVPIVPTFGKQSTSVEHHFNGKVPRPSYLVPCQTCGLAFLATMQGLQ